MPPPGSEVLSREAHLNDLALKDERAVQSLIDDLIRSLRLEATERGRYITGQDVSVQKGVGRALPQTWWGVLIGRSVRRAPTLHRLVVEVTTEPLDVPLE